MKFKNKDKSGGTRGIKAVLIGILVCLTVSLLGAMLVAYIMGKGSIGENSANIYAKIITFIASLLGCLMCVFHVHERVLLMSAYCAAGYLFVLIACNILLFDGKFSGLVISVILILGGAAISTLIRSKTINKNAKTKFRFS